MPSDRRQLDSSVDRRGTSDHTSAVLTLARTGVFVELRTASSYNRAMGPLAGLAGNRVAAVTGPVRRAACFRLDES
jgi:hypothetical protein